MMMIESRPVILNSIRPQQVRRNGDDQRKQVQQRLWHLMSGMNAAVGSVVRLATGDDSNWSTPGGPPAGCRLLQNPNQHRHRRRRRRHHTIR
ncbi:hypothetical protein BHE74_00058876 [Ensete ventricosum]|nr:hypothetical protein BHE74_00058876 [Ensete ventricosum]